MSLSLLWNLVLSPGFARHIKIKKVAVRTGESHEENRGLQMVFVFASLSLLFALSLRLANQL